MEIILSFTLGVIIGMAFKGNLTIGLINIEGERKAKEKDVH